MPIPTEYSFIRYLRAKQPIDDRALNVPVWQRLTVELADLPGPYLHVLEIGAGIGTMIERTLIRGLFPDHIVNVNYTALDADGTLLEALPATLSRAAERCGWGYETTEAGGLLQPGGQRIAVTGLETDVVRWAMEQQAGQYDLLIAHAFLDLLDVPVVLPSLMDLLRPGGLFYFSLNFDGITAFEPEIDLALDHQIEELYHRSMDERTINGKPSGDHRAGRHLLTQVREAGAEVLAAGSSDWVVFADGHSSYPGDEQYFLYHILRFVEETLSGHPELDPSAFREWLYRRRQQVERGEMTYVAHQLDLCGRGSA